MGTSVCDFAFAELRFELLTSLFLPFKRPCNSICVCFNFTLSIKSTVHDELEKWPLVAHSNLTGWCVTPSYFPLPCKPVCRLQSKIPHDTPRLLRHLGCAAGALEMPGRGEISPGRIQVTPPAPLARAAGGGELPGLRGGGTGR